jgi:RNA polymerase sigma factor (sigma-70 family)
MGVLTGFTSDAATNRRFTEIEPKWRPIIRHKMRGITVPGMDASDLYQYGQLAVLYAVAKADPARGTFEAFANEILERTFATLVRDGLREKRMPASRAVHGASTFCEVDEEVTRGHTADPEAILIAEDLRRRLLEQLPEFDRRVAQLRIAPTRELRAVARRRAGDAAPIIEDDLAEVLGCRRSRVKHAITRIRVRMNVLLGEGGPAHGVA